MQIDRFQIEATRRRFDERAAVRARNLRLISQGRLLEVDAPERVDKFLARAGFSVPERTELFEASRSGTLPITKDADRKDRAFERIIGTSDLIGISFLERGLQVARTICRIWIGVAAGRPLGYGTGFLISPRLLLTNHHVLGNAKLAAMSLAEFDYQRDPTGVLVASTSFTLDPGTFYFADQSLDYAVVAVRGDASALRNFGWNQLIEEEGKAIAAQWVNIIQHPNGEPKQLALRENQLIDVLDDFVQYRTDTAPGSSGSPVFNDRWEVIGLHHSGVWKTNQAGQILAVDGQVWRDEMGEDRIQWIANEGIRISKLIKHLRQRQMTPAQRAMFDEVFSAPAVSPISESRNAPSTYSPPPTAPTATVSVHPDGTATWVVPLSVSVKLGGIAAAAPVVTTPVLTSLGASIPTSNIVAPVTDAPESILAAAKTELGARPDVLRVRLGYVFRNGWITKERAIVVTVRQKKTAAALREGGVLGLPESFRGLLIEVTNPTIEDLVRITSGPAAAELAFGPPVIAEEIKYFPPPSAVLTPITESMRVIAHVSPDAGWSQLRPFIDATRNRLVIGMYDFGAPHIADAIQAACTPSAFKRLTLIMQHGENVGTGTKADDLSDDEIVDKFRTSLGTRFENAWVKEGPVNGWISSSYHIKVAVRDQEAFWLSSGNWQSSNQPDGDPLSEHPPQRKWLSQFNREWHAIVEHQGLAQTFETFLLHDFKNNKNFIPPQEMALPDLLIPEAFFIPTSAERMSAFQYFAPLDDTRQFAVCPLLTPDNYHSEALKLVKSAKHELLIQNQTFNAPGDNHDALRELVSAVLEKQRAGVTVRIIFRVLFPAAARQNLSDLQEFGFDMNDFRVQKGCHTKGIIVDRKRLLLGSQNWSNDGVSVNRDASLLFDDETLSQYFAQIFDHDWEHLAKQDIGREALPIEVAPSDAAAPPGMIRLTWKDYMEMV